MRKARQSTAGEVLDARNLRCSNPRLWKAVVSQVRQKIDAVLLTLLRREYILLSQSGKPCVRSDFMHLFAQN